MCGRYTLKTPGERLSEKFQLPDALLLKPRYNIAPSQAVAVVRLLQGAPHRSLDLLSWGLIPAWVKDLARASKPINAKAETAAEKPTFRAAFRKRRCLIPADGFYEWKQEGVRKQPIYIRMKEGGVFAIAGLWEHWESLGGQAIETCTLLTTEPNELLAPIHNRMPVILDPNDYEQWLDPAQPQVDRLKSLLRPYPPVLMTASPVTLRVNNPKNDDPLCVEPLAPGDDA